MEYIVDFNGVKTEKELHQALKDGLDLPYYYGMNMDALWDCLTGDLDDPCVIFIKGINDIPKDLNNKVESMLRMFKDAEEWYRDINFEVRFIIID